MEKMNKAVEAEVRKNLYEVALDALAREGFTTEVIKDGALIHLPDGYFAKVKVSICDATKFDLDVTRAEYQELLQKRAEAAEKKAQKAREKAEKEAVKAIKAAEKDAE